MARRNTLTRGRRRQHRAVAAGPTMPCKNVPGFPFTGDAPPHYPSAVFGIQNGRLQPHGHLHTEAGISNVQIRRVDYVGSTGNLILRIMPGAPVPEPSDNVRQIRVCYVTPLPTRR